MGYRETLGHWCWDFSFFWTWNRVRALSFHSCALRMIWVSIINEYRRICCRALVYESDVYKIHIRYLLQGCAGMSLLTDIWTVISRLETSFPFWLFPLKHFFSYLLWTFAISLPCCLPHRQRFLGCYDSARPMGILICFYIFLKMLFMIALGPWEFRFILILSLFCFYIFFIIFKILFCFVLFF